MDEKKPDLGRLAKILSESKILNINGKGFVYYLEENGKVKYELTTTDQALQQDLKEKGYIKKHKNIENVFTIDVKKVLHDHRALMQKKKEELDNKQNLSKPKEDKEETVQEIKNTKPKKQHYKSTAFSKESSAQLLQKNLQKNYDFKFEVKESGGKYRVESKMRFAEENIKEALKLDEKEFLDSRKNMIKLQHNLSDRGISSSLEINQDGNLGLKIKNIENGDISKLSYNIMHKKETGKDLEVGDVLSKEMLEKTEARFYKKRNNNIKRSNDNNISKSGGIIKLRERITKHSSKPESTDSKSNQSLEKDVVTIRKQKSDYVDDANSDDTKKPTPTPSFLNNVENNRGTNPVR